MLGDVDGNAPNTFMPGFDFADVAAGKYGRHIHFRDFEGRKIVKSVDMDADGMIALEMRGLHDPESSEGMLTATLFSNVFRWRKVADGDFEIERVIDIPTVDARASPCRCPRQPGRRDPGRGPGRAINDAAPARGIQSPIPRRYGGCIVFVAPPPKR